VLVQADRISSVVDITEFDALLAAQNTLRAKHNLPPLPHPRTVLATSVKTAPPTLPRFSGPRATIRPGRSGTSTITNPPSSPRPGKPDGSDGDGDGDDDTGGKDP
jgi:hypothetical protein